MLNRLTVALVGGIVVTLAVASPHGLASPPQTGTSGAVYASVNGGVTFTRTLIPNASVNGVAVDPTNAAHVYAATSAGIYQSTDGGLNWSRSDFIENGERQITTDFFGRFAIDPNNPCRVFATASRTGRSLAVTEDCGTTWAFATWDRNRWDHVWSVDVAATSPETTYFTGGAGQAYLVGRCRGTSCSYSALGFVAHVLAVDPSNSCTVFVGEFFGGIRRNTDCFDWNWSPVDGVVGVVEALAVHPTNQSTVIAGTGTGAIYKSSSQTGGWGLSALLGAPVRSIVYQPLDPTVLFAVSGSGVFRSLNSGSSWPVLSQLSGTLSSIAISESNPSIMYVSAEGLQAWAPVISTQPQSHVVSPGTPATLSVVAAGTGPLSYQWYQGASPSTATPIADANSPSYTTPLVFAPASYWVRVTNGAGVANSVTATVSIGVPRTIQLTGNLAFGPVAVSTAVTSTLTISNIGTGPLTVSGITYPAGFSGAWSGAIAPGASQNVTVTFAPVLATSYSGTLVVAADHTGGTNTAIASGAGTQPPLLTVTRIGNGTGTVTSIPAGIVCGATCSMPFAQDQVVELIATPAAGSMFSGFAGDADCYGAHVEMRTVRNCTALFTLGPGPGPTSSLYVTTNSPTGGAISELQGTSVKNTWPTIGRETALVVTDAIRTLGAFIPKYTASYSLAGQFLGSAPMSFPYNQITELDGTNYWGGNLAVSAPEGRIYRYGTNWQPGPLEWIEPGVSGITFDPSNLSLWVAGRGPGQDSQMIRNFSTISIKEMLSSFELAGSAPARALALDPADSTLWVQRFHDQPTESVWEQYSKQGVLLSWIKYPTLQKRHWGAEFAAITDSEPFLKIAPANYATGKTLVVLSWRWFTGATGYEYCIDTTNDNACEVWTSTGTNTSVSLKNLPADTTYYWQARAMHPGGPTYADGAESRFWTFKTHVPDPSNPGPFGQVDTPSQNATGVQGAIGITGWALDDAAVTKVEIFRNCLAFEPANCQTVLGHNVVYIGEAAFLPGARPDVAAAYPTYPNKHRAGWGYLMLTPMLPHVPNSEHFGGQGSLTLYAIASDTSGHKTLLGRSADPGNPAYATPTTIAMTNDTIAKPFGTIDTPLPGETIAGLITNYGWAVTPDSNTVSGDSDDIVIPTTPFTMKLFINGFLSGFVDYDQCRGTVGNPVPAGIYCNDDVANILGNVAPKPPFAQRTSNPTRFRNLDAGRGAIGSYRYISSGSYPPGLHTLAWSVTDSLGRTEGIGSRFFKVAGAPDSPAAPAEPLGDTTRLTSFAPDTNGVWGRTGFDLNAPWIPMRANDDGTFAVRLPELGRLELSLGGTIDAGYLVSNDALHPLPIGASFVGDQFAWTPPVGYTGPYRLAFVRNGRRIEVNVTIVEKPQAIEGVAQIRMHLAQAEVSRQSVRVTGSAYDPQAAIGSGIAAVHVWATPIGGTSGTPFFVGSAALDQSRPGFSLTVALKPGTYTLTAYAWNERTARWEDARSVTAVVK